MAPCWHGYIAAEIDTQSARTRANCADCCRLLPTTTIDEVESGKPRAWSSIEAEATTRQDVAVSVWSCFAAWLIVTGSLCGAVDRIDIVLPDDAGFRGLGLQYGDHLGTFAAQGLEIRWATPATAQEPWFAVRRVALPRVWAAGEDLALIAILQQRNPDVALVAEDSPWRSLPALWQDPASRIAARADGTRGPVLVALNALGLQDDRLADVEDAGRIALRDGRLDCLFTQAPVDVAWLSRENMRVRALPLGPIAEVFIGDSLICTGTTFREQPALIQRVRSAVLAGWTATLRHPTAAIEAMAAASPGEPDRRERLRLRLLAEAPSGIALLDAHVVPLGSISLARLLSIQQAYSEQGIAAEVREDLIYISPGYDGGWGVVLVVLGASFVVLVLSLVIVTQRQHRALTENQAHYHNLVDLAVTYLAFRMLVHPHRFVPELASPSILDLFGYPLTRYQRTPALFLRQLTSASRRELLIAVEQSLRNSQSLQMTIRLRHRDGGLRQFLLNARPSQSERGLVIDGICLDLTTEQRAQEEHRLLQQQLAIAQRHESLGMLAGGVAHDFNNILGAIRGNAELLRPVTRDHAMMAKRLDRVLMAVDRANGLVRQILAYAGSGAIEPRPLNLAEEIRQIAGLLQHGLPPGIQIELALADSLPSVVLDQIQFQQVAINLIMNAAESYESQPGLVTISLVPQGSGDLLLRVSDLGAGMDKATMLRMWDPYFTTKVQGHGLGLAAVRGIIEHAGGHIDCHSAPGKGTTIAVSLPVAKPSRRTTGLRERTSPAVAVGQGVVLIVDDDPLIRETIEALVKDLGYETMCARGGLEGLTSLKLLAERCTTVLLDCRMPDLDGPSTLRRLRQQWPELPVILVSGYERDEVLRAGLDDDPYTRFLAKPFTASQLVASLSLVRGLGGDPPSSAVIPIMQPLDPE